MGHWPFQAVGVSVNHSGELTLQSREDIIEGKSVGGQVNPSGVGGEKCQSLSGPQAIRLRPGGHVGVVLHHVRGKCLHVVLPEGSAVSIQVCFENAGPLLAGDVLVEGTESCRAFHRGNGKLVGELNVGFELLVSLIVLVVEGTALILDNPCEAVHVGSSGGGSNLGSETVTTDSRHRDLSLVHESNDIISHVFHVVAGVVVTASLVAVVNEPHVTHVQHLVLALSEELLEVCCGLRDLGQPDHSGQVLLATLQECALEANISCVVNLSSFYTRRTKCIVSSSLL